MASRRRWLAVLAGAVAACGIAMASPKASAQDGTTVAIIDMQHLMQQSMAGKSIESQIFEHRTVVSREIGQREERLRARELQLEQQAAILSPEAFAEQRQQFEQEVVALQGYVEQRQATLESAYNEAIQTLQSAIFEILRSLIVERGIDVVLGRANYLVADSALDLTEDALAELDQVLPSVTLSLPSGE